MNAIFFTIALLLAGCNLDTTQPPYVGPSGEGPHFTNIEFFLCPESAQSANDCTLPFGDTLYTYTNYAVSVSFIGAEYLAGIFAWKYEADGFCPTVNEEKTLCFRYGLWGPYGTDSVQTFKISFSFWKENIEYAMNFALLSSTVGGKVYEQKQFLFNNVRRGKHLPPPQTIGSSF